MLKKIYHKFKEECGRMKLELRKRQILYSRIHPIGGGGKPAIIISLTSFKPRLDMLHFALRSLFLQTHMPDRIILYFGDDVKEKDLTNETLKLKQYGLEIEFRQDDLKSHKKYYYAMTENPDAIIVTVDDDFIYPSNMLESLVKLHEDSPDCIITVRAHRIKFDHEGEILPYMQWDWEYGGNYAPVEKSLCNGRCRMPVSTTSY